MDGRAQSHLGGPVGRSLLPLGRRHPCTCPQASGLFSGLVTMDKTAPLSGGAAFSDSGGPQPPEHQSTQEEKAGSRRCPSTAGVSATSGQGGDEHRGSRDASRPAGATASTDIVTQVLQRALQELPPSGAENMASPSGVCHLLIQAQTTNPRRSGPKPGCPGARLHRLDLRPGTTSQDVGQSQTPSPVHKHL